MSLADTPGPNSPITERLASRAAAALEGLASLPRQSRDLIAEALEREEEMRLLLEGATELAIGMLDPSGYIMHWPRGAEQLTQYGEEQAIGCHFDQFFTEMDQMSGLPARALAVAKAEGRYEVEHWFVRRNRSGFWGAQLIQPVVDEERQLVGFVTVIRDGTQTWLERVALTRAKEDAEAAAAKADELAAELLAANTDLQQANDSLQKFTSIVAHDLRAPLLRVEALVKFIAEDYSEAFDADGRDIVSRIEAGIGRIRLMLASLLDYSKCSRTAIQGKTANLAPILSGAIEDLGVQAETAAVSIDLGENSVDVAGDPQLLAHVLQNLIGNALKFRHADKRPVITVQSRRTASGDIEVSVSDNGIGIEPQFATRVFEMFYRLHTEEAYAGTGIGLTVCRKIITDHGGRIWVDDAYSGGTRVVFTLKPAPGAETATSPKTWAGQPPASAMPPPMMAARASAAFAAPH